MKFPTIDEFAKNVAEKALDEIYGGKTIREWVEILVKQQPWEDCISRQAVLNAIQKLNIPEDMCVFEIKSHIEVKIATLPSVTPQPKTGRWINDSCSECGKGIKDLIDSREWYENEMPNFCPFCGIQIESED